MWGGGITLLYIVTLLWNGPFLGGPFGSKSPTLALGNGPQMGRCRAVYLSFLSFFLSALLRVICAAPHKGSSGCVATSCASEFLKVCREWDVLLGGLSVGCLTRECIGFDVVREEKKEKGAPRRR